MKLNKQIKRVIFTLLFIFIFMIVYPIRNLFGTSNYFIIKLIYIIYSSFTIWLVYLLLRKYKEKSQFINNYFKHTLFGLSILVAIATGFLHLGYLKLFVIPDSLYCTYYDDYRYKLYTFETGCEEIVVTNKKYQGDQLKQLSYEIDQKRYERYYEDGRVIKTIEEQPNVELKLNDNQSIVVNQEIITEYTYEDTIFKQNRFIQYKIDDHEFMQQEGYYESKRIEAEDDSELLYRIEIQKRLLNPTLTVTKSEFSDIFTASYITKNDIQGSAEQLVDSLLNYMEQQTQITDYSFDVSRPKHYLELKMNGEDYGYDRYHFYKDDIYLFPNHSIDSDYGFHGKKEIEIIRLSYNNHQLVLSEYGIKKSPVSYGLHQLLFSCDDTDNYCDATLGGGTLSERSVVFRNLIDQNGPITKVESFYVYERNVFEDYKDWVITENIPYTKDYFPFDHDVSFSEIYEEPKPYLFRE